MNYILNVRPKCDLEEFIDFSTGEIQIIDSKWHKSRTVVMSEDMLVLMKKYASSLAILPKIK